MLKYLGYILMFLYVMAHPLSGQAAMSFEQGGYKYEITSVQEGEVTIVGLSEGFSPDPDLTFPESISYNNRTFKITAIGDDLFKGSSITSLTLPTSLKSIGNYTFYGCSQLKKVTLPNPLREVGVWAFGNCTGLAALSLNTFLSSVGESAFNGCTSLTKVEANLTNLKTIGERAFENCHSLESFRSGCYTETIGKSAFKNCECLISPDFGWNNLRQKVVIGDSAFYNTSSLNSLPNMDKVYTFMIYPSAFENSGISGILSLSLNNSGAAGDGWDDFNGTLCKRAFAHTQIDSIYIQDARLLDSVFVDCPKLRGIEFTTVSMYGTDLFAGCESLKRAKLSYHRARKGCMRNIPGLETVQLKYFRRSPGYGYGDANWGEVCEEMFADCINLKALTAANSFSVIASNAFINCKSLTDISMPNMRMVYQKAFYNCTSLSNIGEHSGLWEVQEEAFFNTDLRTFTFGDTLGIFEKNAVFPLDTIYMARKTPESAWLGNTYEFTEENFLNTVLVVQPGTIRRFQKTSPWNMFWNIIEASDASAIETLPVDDKDAPVEYFNLNGIKINEERLLPGLYIKRQGEKTEKVLIK